MQQAIDTLTALLQANGGSMEYSEVYDHPDVVALRPHLKRALDTMYAQGTLARTPLQRNEAGRWVSVLTLGGE